jgi:hypothetical protein
MSFDSPQFARDNRAVSHLFKDHVIETHPSTWFDKVKNGDRQAVHSLLLKCYIGEANFTQCAKSATLKLEKQHFRSRNASHQCMKK